MEYIEVEPSEFNEIPQMNISITENDSFKEYTDEEIMDIANQTEEVVSEHIDIPSKWSGNMYINDDGIQNSDGHTTYYGKMWNCDILTKHVTAPAVIMHEQIHARSISYYGQEEYFQFRNIEESTVQFMTEEICIKENIEIIPSEYGDLTKALRQIRNYMGTYSSDYEFAKELIEKPVRARFDWLSDKLYDILGSRKNATIEEYQQLSELLDLLY